ncbi:MAG: NAD(P)-binding domain-containing protein, partial [Planctomycetota bacterium]|nr:NAD(P)-binding domain-containing protein [Planctomycetota bacterium]
MAEKPRVGWIGTGVMGAPMAGHLLAAGYALTVFNRTKAKADGLLGKGATWAASPAE